MGDYIDRGLLAGGHLQDRARHGGVLAAPWQYSGITNSMQLHGTPQTLPLRKVLLRPRHGATGAKNRQQHQHFLAEVEGTRLHDEIIEWFLTLPLWLDLPELRVIHACWHDGYISELKPLLGPSQTLTTELMVRASRQGDAVLGSS